MSESSRSRRWRNLAFLIALLACLALTRPVLARTSGPLVLAASSLQEALTAAADRWEAKGNARPVLSFAASSALARQGNEGLEAGRRAAGGHQEVIEFGAGAQTRREAVDLNRPVAADLERDQGGVAAIGD